MGRLRFNKKAESFLSADSIYMLNTSSSSNLFTNENKIYVEIGMGKGDFIIQQAIDNPDINFIGIEKYSTVMMIALKKAKKYDLKNLKLINADAKELAHFLEPKSINKIFLNFSDPWPKKRHTERRLTSSTFLNIYREILKDDGVIEFKTDNQKLYDFTLENLSETSIKNIILYHSNDIYLDINNEYNLNNIQTEYEKKFLSLGETIKKIIFKFK